MTDHTEGQWYKESGDDDTFGYDVYYIHANGGKMVCEGICNPHDADLLVSAKDTLDALEKVKYEIGMMYLPTTNENRQYKTKALKIIDAAIKRAKGES